MTLLPCWKRLLNPLIFGLLASLAFSASSKATIQYEVSLDHPEHRLFHVRMTIPNVAEEVTVQMAAWNALYQIRDFSAHVQQVEAFSESGKVAAEKIDKQTWRIRANGTISVQYTTYWDEAGPFGTQLNSEHAFINPAMILLYVPDRRGQDVHLSLPDVPEQWNAAGPSIQLVESMGKARNFGGSAPNYDALVDAPIEVGRFEEFQLPGIRPEIWVVIHGDNWSRKQVESDLTKICKYELQLMGGAPFEHYTFIVHVGKGAGGGGMEHSNSTAIGVPSDEYLPDVAAHEFFHLWNVKRIRPASLEPVDYTKEQYTRALWFAEGVTSTYGSYTLLRSGIWSKERFYEDLGGTITELEQRPANRWQSAEQSSLDAWLEKYDLYNQPEFSVSYYAKGQVLGELLDIVIRDRTDNAKSLDDLLSAMNQDFAKQGKFYRDSLDVRLMAEKIAGGSLEEFFQKYVSGTEPFPYQQVLGLAGLDERAVERHRAILSFTAERDSTGALVVRSVDAQGTAAKAGLRVGDVIISWNGGEIPQRPGLWLNQQKPGDVLRLRIRREGKEMAVEFRLGEMRETVYEVTENPHANEQARNLREGWLRGQTGAAVHR